MTPETLDWYRRNNHRKCPVTPLCDEIERLQGMLKWASGRLLDAGDAEAAQQALDAR